MPINQKLSRAALGVVALFLLSAGRCGIEFKNGRPHFPSAEERAERYQNCCKACRDSYCPGGNCMVTEEYSNCLKGCEDRR